MRNFSQVDVFSSEPLLGNPVAVVHDADGIGDDEMAAFARWTNLSETTFLLTPTTDEADYRLRIFTPGQELPFAGHPTIGSAHAWLEAGGVPRTEGELVQECGAGLVQAAAGRAAGVRGAALHPVRARCPRRTANGSSGRCGSTPRRSATWSGSTTAPAGSGCCWTPPRRCWRIEPDWSAAAGMDIGVVGPYPDGSECAVEIRAFCPEMGIAEDPVTGSLNAGVAQWLAGDRLPTSYVASQGTALGRRGRVFIEREGDTVWVGGDARTTITGTRRTRRVGLAPCGRTSTSSSGSSTRAWRRATAPAPARCRSSATRCVSTWPRASRSSPPRRSTPGRCSPSCCGSSAATPTSSGSRTAASRSGTSGPTPTATWVPSTATSGGRGRRPTARTSTRSPRWWRRSATTPTAGGTSSRPGTSPTSRRWRSRPATRCSSSTSPTAGCRASSTNGPPTCSSACRSTSRRTPC